MVLNQESLKMDRRDLDYEKSLQRVNESNLRITNRSFRKKKILSKRWNDSDTDKFYKASFHLIAILSSHYSRDYGNLA